jgi:hypothetical protein
MAENAALLVGLHELQNFYAAESRECEDPALQVSSWVCHHLNPYAQGGSYSRGLMGAGCMWRWLVAHFLSEPACVCAELVRLQPARRPFALFDVHTFEHGQRAVLTTPRRSTDPDAICPALPMPASCRNWQLIFTNSRRQCSLNPLSRLEAA